MKNLLANLYWWADEHAEEIGRALLWFVLGLLASPFIICAAFGMYENATADEPAMNEAYWIKCGYEPLNH